MTRKSIKSISRRIRKAALIMTAVIVTVSAAPATTAQAAGATTNVAVTAKVDYSKATQVLNLINKERAKKGLKKLKMDKTLLNNAVLRAEECGVYYSHTRANGTKWSTAITKSKKKSAENIAYNFNTADKVVNAWMNSSGHKKNIMNKSYTCIGIGCVEIDGKVYWAQEFTDGKAKAVSCSGAKTETVNIKTANSYISVKNKAEKITITAGQTVQAEMKLTNAGTKAATAVAKTAVRYASSNGNIATVDSNGVIRGVASGTATVTLTLSGSITKTYTVTVK